MNDIENKINKISDKDKFWKRHLLHDLKNFKEKGYIRNGDIFITDIDTAKKYLNDGINMIDDKNINFDKYESGLTPEEIENKIKNIRRNKTMANEEEKGYSGWRNYETWNAKLWMDNDEFSQNTSKELAQEARSDDRGDWIADLAMMLKEWQDEDRPDLGATMWADLLNSAFQEISWREIAENIIDGILEDEKYEAEKNKKEEDKIDLKTTDYPIKEK
jgi:hypothetical protein